MNEPNPHQDGEEILQEEEKKPSYTPASFEKRTAAWMGLAYMVMLVALMTYTISTARTLPGTAPLLLVPVAAAILVITIHRQRRGVAPGGLPFSVVVCLVCVAAIVLGLLMGIPALLAGLSQGPAPL